MEIAFDHFVGALLAQRVVDAQVGHEAAFLPAVAVVLGGADVGLEMHVGLGGGAHHARRVHLDRLQVHCADLHAAALLRFADGIFLRLGERGEQQGRDGERGGDAHWGASGKL